MLDDFLVRAALAAVGVALPAGLLGSFVVWRRMAYFGDATAHAAILGVALALMFELSVLWGVVAVALAMAAALHALEGQGREVNSALGVLAHGGLAAGLLAVALVPGGRVDLDAYLFGDVLTVTRGDLVVIWGGGALVAALLIWRWSALLTATLNPDLAAAAGIDARRETLLLVVLMALMVAVALKVVGALLITALLIIPAAAARGLTRTPEAMAGVAALIGGVAALGGLGLALRLDTPVGPSIVCVAASAYAAIALAGALRR
ncbi:zinc ABC transporter, permease protein [Oceanicola granulosus HTCC2516]|uniref:High-affinity zinc uptake system membrane protein ZnuB n=1 Tax=Oceanicola granulosus (strain ATCC BAA-861 / DSM 15982 / KCTC 12143 / HTCC2516) TaxID=314256 RepID=Q2CAY0_OCEGH|nr:metal ABC transporter permease [Oceanicola granulosus]EAR49845.1 zinc ABC transporter, permease protein [Oceanicola granulosus HTCC2516]